MAEEKRMVTGFNHNVKHRGKAYHVQTEDSGLGNPHIVTHLFLGGSILASKKTVYAEITGVENLPAVVRELMEDQHKEVLRNLVAGIYDEVEEAIGTQARFYQPGEIAPAVQGGRIDPPPVQPLHLTVSPSSSSPAARAAALTVSLARPPPLAQAKVAVPPPLPPAAPPLVPEIEPIASEPEERLAAALEPLLDVDLLSEKSLDEVILSYLAEDLSDRKP